MGKKIWLVLYLLFLWGFSYGKNWHDFGEKAIFTFITNDYEKLFSMFYIPPGYEKNKKEDFENDREAIVEWGKFIAKKFGNIKSFSEVNKIDQRFFKFAINPGPFKELKYKTGKFVIYNVQFSNYGNGYIAFEIINIGDNLYLKSVVLILPENNPKTNEFYEELFKFMINLAKKQEGRRR